MEFGIKLNLKINLSYKQLVSCDGRATTLFFDLKTRALKIKHMEHTISIILIQYLMVQIMKKRNFICLIPMEILFKRWR